MDCGLALDGGDLALDDGDKLADSQHGPPLLVQKLGLLMGLLWGLPHVLDCPIKWA